MSNSLPHTPAALRRRQRLECVRCTDWGGLITAVPALGLRGCHATDATVFALPVALFPAIWGAAFAGFAVVGDLALTLVMLGIAGAADTITVVLRGAVVQVNVPDRVRGRDRARDGTAAVRPPPPQRGGAGGDGVRARSVPSPVAWSIEILDDLVGP